MLTLELMEKLWHAAQHDYVTNHVALHREYGRTIEQAVRKECEAELKRLSICELGAINLSVMDYMKHWEGRVEKAEAKSEADARDAARYRWLLENFKTVQPSVWVNWNLFLQDSHGKIEEQIERSIDAAMAEQEKKG